jgi:hypothetical protein
VCFDLLWPIVGLDSSSDPVTALAFGEQAVNVAVPAVLAALGMVFDVGAG